MSDIVLVTAGWGESCSVGGGPAGQARKATPQAWCEKCCWKAVLTAVLSGKGILQKTCLVVFVFGGGFFSWKRLLSGSCSVRLKKDFIGVFWFDVEWGNAWGVVKGFRTWCFCWVNYFVTSPVTVVFLESSQKIQNSSRWQLKIYFKSSWHDCSDIMSFGGIDYQRYLGNPVRKDSPLSFFLQISSLQKRSTSKNGWCGKPGQTCLIFTPILGRMGIFFHDLLKSQLGCQNLCPWRSRNLGFYVGRYDQGPLLM